MAFTKQEILDMPGPVVDEYVLEQVFQYGRVAGLAIGGASAGQSWIESVGSEPWERLDQTQASPVPRYVGLVRGQVPPLDTMEWMHRILQRAGALGVRANILASGAQWSVAFTAAGAGAPAAAITITVDKMEDAVRRAALLAVQ